MSDHISVRGARVNNLRSVDVDIPKHALTVVTGVSGSGKSSLVFDTVAAESRRLINETYSSFIQGFMPTLARPDVDLLAGLTAAITVDQQPMGANPRSTVGTATDATAMLRVLFSRIAEPSAGGPGAYSFNVPSVSGGGALKVGAKTKVLKQYSRTGGMCPTCEGTGRVSDFDLHELVDVDLSLTEGAMTIPGYKTGGWNYRMYTESGLLDPDKKIRDYSDAERETLFHQEPTRRKIAGINMTYEGLVPRLKKSMLTKDREAMQKHIGEFVDRAVTFVACPDCGGTRLAPHALASRINGRNIAELCLMEVSDLQDWLRGLTHPNAQPLIDAIVALIDSFVAVGLGYLTLDRPTATLSGGEAQRAKLIRHVGSPLTDITFIVDEPAAGLHPADIEKVNRILLQLRDVGNTVIVVEHKPETIAIADHVIDVGPGAGPDGGQVIYSGPLAELKDSGTITARHLNDRVPLKDSVRKRTGVIEIRGASRNNLRDVDVDIPLGVLTAVTGVAGSGKSSLIAGLSRATGKSVLFVDQGAISGSRRSNPGTYTGALDPIRKAFAKANRVTPSLFSANSEGACPNCKGAGVIYVDFGFMAGLESPCEVCEGRRFDEAVLEFTLGGLDIAQVLELPAVDATQFCAENAPAGAKICQRLVDVGLGYITLGQPLTTLSGGERQRLKLATHLGSRKADLADVLVLDEPTTGLHLADADVILDFLDRLVDSGRTLIVIEHNLAVVAHADHVIDLGPGAGSAGGRAVFEGSPVQLAAHAGLTGTYLARYLGDVGTFPVNGSRIHL